jgi:hypothetical protein
VVNFALQDKVDAACETGTVVMDGVATVDEFVDASQADGSARAGTIIRAAATFSVFKCPPCSRERQGATINHPMRDVKHQGHCCIVRSGIAVGLVDGGCVGHAA